MTANGLMSRASTSHPFLANAILTIPEPQPISRAFPFGDFRSFIQSISRVESSLGGYTVLGINNS